MNVRVDRQRRPTEREGKDDRDRLRPDPRKGAQVLAHLGIGGIVHPRKIQAALSSLDLVQDREDPWRLDVREATDPDGAAHG